MAPASLTATKARLGLILSSGNRAVERQLGAFAPPSLAVHVTRMRMAKDRTRTMPEQIDIVLRAAALVADAKVDLIILQASAFAMEKGPDAEETVVRMITKTTGIPALTSTQAMVRGAQALGLKRLVSISPSSPAMNAKEKAYLEASGFEVPHAVGLNVEGGTGLTMTPADWLDIVTTNARTDADGYFLSGSNTTIVETVGAIERATGKPAVASTQATLWACLRQLAPKLGTPAVVAGLGQLFGTARTDTLSAMSNK